MGLDPRGQVSRYGSGALAASGIISTTPCWFYGFTGYNSGPAQWIHLFNAVAVPANGAVPSIAPVSIPAIDNFFFNVGELGYFFSTGLCWSNSTTLATKTLGAADVWLDCSYLPRRV